MQGLPRQAKFGGPGRARRKCFNRQCLAKVHQSKDEQKPTAAAKPAATGDEDDEKASKKEEARMQRELARIRAELDERASKVKGYKAPLGRRSSRRIEEQILTEEEEEDSSSDEENSDSDSDTEEESSDSESETESESSGDEDDSHPSQDLCDAVYRTAMTAGMSGQALPRGVTVRPSGKWVSSVLLVASQVCLCATSHIPSSPPYFLQQVQIYYAGVSRYIGLFDNKQEAAAAYEMARECSEGLADDNPSPQRVKKNIEKIRKAAFSGGEWKSRHMAASRKRREDKKPVAEAKGSSKSKRAAPALPTRKRKEREDASKKAEGARAKLGLRHASKPPAAKPAPVSKKAAPAPPKAKRARVERPKPVKAAPAPKVPKAKKPAWSSKKSTWDNLEKEAEKIGGKRTFNNEIYERAKSLANKLPRGITVRPSGKWVSAATVKVHFFSTFASLTARMQLLLNGTAASPDVLPGQIEVHGRLRF